MLSTFFRRQPRIDAQLKVGTALLEPSYDPGLVSALCIEHRSLVMMLVKASNAARRQRYEDIREILEQFKTDLRDHLKREGAELLPYLAAHLKGEDNKDLLKDMRGNTLYIERAVDGFLKHYAQYPVNEKTVLRFEMELSGVIEEFSERLEREEASFYTLYLPRESY
jgi:hemerythrin HHE cation binding domain-containing protein